MPTVYTEVDVELHDFETDDLVEELESRGALPVEGDVNAKEIVEQMYQLRRLGKRIVEEAKLARKEWRNPNGNRND